MKKSKIIGITLGCFGITSIGVITPFIATSCNSSDATSNEKLNFSLIKENTISLSKNKPIGLELERIEGTNNFNLFSDQKQWDGTEVEHIVFSNPNGNGIFDWVSKEKLLNMGFDKKLLNSEGQQEVDLETGINREIMLDIGIKDINGNIYYPTYTLDTIERVNKVFEKSDKNKSLEFFKTFKILQFDNAKYDKDYETLETEINEKINREEFNKLSKEKQQEIMNKIINEIEKIRKNATEKEEIFEFSLKINPKKLVQNK